jgi:signal transduction histidine kinase
MKLNTESSPRILLVDDNPAFVENLAEILQAQGYSVTPSLTCSAAMAEAAKGFDLVLVDVKLPDGDGTSLAQKLKDMNSESEVILLTGYGTLESAAAAVRAGAWAYLLKPCDTQELLLTLEQAMRQVRLRHEKAELARRAQVAEKLAAVGTLTAGLSHEIRNPLNAAALQLSVLQRRVARLPKELQGSLLEPLLLVRDEIRRLDHVLEDFMQFARPTHFVPKQVELSAPAEKVHALLADDAERRGIRLECRCPEGAVVAGDEGRLRQLFMNLALNALDAAPRGGWVKMESRIADREVIFTIEDNGAGIPADAMHRIFEPFFTTKASGSGLGLPIVHAIVTQHGGSIGAENVPGGGARFTVRLPRFRGQLTPSGDSLRGQ